MFRQLLGCLPVCLPACWNNVCSQCHINKYLRACYLLIVGAHCSLFPELIQVRGLTKNEQKKMSKVSTILPVCCRILSFPFKVTCVPTICFCFVSNDGWANYALSLFDESVSDVFVIFQIINNFVRAMHIAHELWFSLFDFKSMQKISIMFHFNCEEISLNALWAEWLTF